MGSSSKKRQTMAKMTRERAVKEKRALKQEKKDNKKLAALAALSQPVDEFGVPLAEGADQGAAGDDQQGSEPHVTADQLAATQ